MIRIFQTMKDYIAETQGLVMQRDLLRLSMQTTENTEAVRSIHTMLEEPLCTSPPYGYVKDPEDRLRWIVDEEAAGHVR